MPFEDVPPSRPTSERPADVPPGDGIQERPLEVAPSGVEEPTPSSLTPDERQWAMFAHLSALVGFLIGGLTFLGPLIVWLIKKDESKFVDYHGKESLNFQLNVLIYNLICVAIGIATCGIGFFVTGPLMGAIFIVAIIMPIIAGMKANEGKFYEYPLTFRIIK